MGAALLFGASTPLAKWLSADSLASSPFMLAGLLYLEAVLTALLAWPGPSTTT